jgi:hypothetical protein
VALYQRSLGRVQEDPPLLQRRVERGVEVELGVDDREAPPRLRSLQGRGDVGDIDRPDLGDRPGQRLLDRLVQVIPQASPVSTSAASGGRCGTTASRSPSEYTARTAGKSGRGTPAENSSPSLKSAKRAALVTTSEPGGAASMASSAWVSKSCSVPVLGCTSTCLPAAHR